MECGGAAALGTLSRRDLQDLCIKRGVGDPASSDEELRAGLAAWLAAIEPTAASGAAATGAGAKDNNRKDAKGSLEANSASASLLSDPVRKRAMLLSWNAVQACRTQDLAAPHRALFTAPSLQKRSESQTSLGSQAAFLMLTAVPAAAAGVLVGNALSTGSISFGSSSSGEGSALQRSSDAPKAALEVPSLAAGQTVGASLVSDATNS